MGKLVTTLINEFQTAGMYSINWDASDLSSGIYILKLNSNDLTKTKKIALIK